MQQKELIDLMVQCTIYGNNLKFTLGYFSCIHKMGKKLQQEHQNVEIFHKTENIKKSFTK